MLTGNHARVNTLMYDINVVKKFRFRRPRVKVRTAFSKNPPLESAFKNSRFRSPKTSATCGRKVTTKDYCVFENYLAPRRWGPRILCWPRECANKIG